VSVRLVVVRLVSVRPVFVSQGSMRRSLPAGSFGTGRSVPLLACRYAY
jgi:hypothetical protein